MTMLTDLEGTGEKFSLEALLDVRSRTRKAVHLIADQVQPGMAEEEAKAIARETLQSMEMRRGWHHIILRCGPNTTKDFMERSEPRVVLGDDDIFFVDIGPIYGDTEGDAGDTFVLGSDPEHLRAKREVRQIWDQVREEWFTKGSTGPGALPLRHLGGGGLRTGTSTWTSPAIGCRTFLTPRITTVRWLKSSTGRIPISGSSKLPSPTLIGTSGRSTRTSFSRTSPFPNRPPLAAVAGQRHIRVPTAPNPQGPHKGASNT